MILDNCRVALAFIACLHFVCGDLYGGSSLRSWQLTHELTSLQTGVITIDDDLTYLYGQLPGSIREAAIAKMTKNVRRIVTDVSVAALIGFGWLFTDGLALFTGFTDTDPETPHVGDLLEYIGDFFQVFSFIGFRTFSLNKNPSPSCGVEDYQKTWDNYYDAANLRETYNFMASGSQIGYHFAGRQGGLSEVDPGNITYNQATWNPIYDSYSSPEAQPRDGYGGASPTSSSTTVNSRILDNLRVDNFPTVMEYRVCQMSSQLRSSLFCLFDDSLADSRILQECINNIEDVSNSRLEVTQKMVDIELELTKLEEKEY